MTRVLAYGLVAALIVGFASASGAKEYPARWVYVSQSLRADADVEAIERIVRTASEHGLNGMVLSAGLDRLDLQPEEYLQRLARVREICEKARVEIIPCIFSVGYGGSVLAYNRNLAAGIPVIDVPFVVNDGRVILDLDRTPAVANGGFEQRQGDRVEGYMLQDKPGGVSFVDSQVVRSGRASLRLEGFGQNEHGHGRIMQEVEVQPHRCYRLSCWVKTDALEPKGAFHLLVLGPDGRDVAPYDPEIPSTTDWRHIVMGFNSLNCDKVRIYAGVWEGRAGRVWIDDVAIEEVALLNILRRPGTPLTVQNEDTGQKYEEGRDFGPVRDRTLTFRFDHEPPEMAVTPDSRIRNGDRLKISYFHGTGVHAGQVSICMSEPEVYRIWEKQAGLMHKVLAPSKYLLSMDEIRAGGSCQACRQRHMTMAQILGDCITKQTAMLRRVNPKAEVFCWSDMLDPNHNAHGDYYLVEGDFTGSWNYVPKDLGIVCWYYDIRDKSLAFFSSQGFRTVAGAYYDADTLENPVGWLDVLDKTPNAIGIMYTTWENKYALLGPFGDLVKSRGK